MENFKKILKIIDSGELTLKEIVLIIEMLGNKIDINSISGMARSENKTPSGIRNSNKYRKIKFGCALLCVSGLDDSKLPF